LVIETFLDDVPKEIQKLRDSLAAGDMALVERQAHSIKGASANVGGEALRAVALEMEHAAKAGDVDRVHACLARLDAEFARLKAAMDRRLHT
jgi:HPt (histidine-containing phosphotransfer) domain-containing protein